MLGNQQIRAAAGEMKAILEVAGIGAITVVMAAASLCSRGAEAEIGVNITRK